MMNIDVILIMWTFPTLASCESTGLSSSDYNMSPGAEINSKKCKVFLSKKFHRGTQSHLTKLRQDKITLINEFCKVWTQPVCYLDAVWCFYSPMQLSFLTFFPLTVGGFRQEIIRLLNIHFHLSVVHSHVSKTFLADCISSCKQIAWHTLVGGV